MTTMKEKRFDNLFSFARRKDSGPDRAEREKAAASELEEGLASVMEAIERLAAKVDALTGEGGSSGR